MMLDDVATVLAVLALIANALVVAALLGFLLSRAGRPLRGAWDAARDAITPVALPSAFIVAVIATAGSLWFQFGAGLTPCEFCWLQRICMYPQSLLLGIAAFRRELFTARRYFLPIVVVGVGLSIYQYQLQRNPGEPQVCGIAGQPSCAGTYFNIFGFITIPYLALSAFLLIITLLLMAREERPEWEDEPPVSSDQEGFLRTPVPAGRS
jgi:disulfide bond formation protein DsbB